MDKLSPTRVKYAELDTLWNLVAAGESQNLSPSMHGGTARTPGSHYNTLYSAQRTCRGHSCQSMHAFTLAQRIRQGLL